MGTGGQTFLFADLVGFTALTERCGDEAAADLALAFIADAAGLADARGCEVVKSLGDAVMVHGEDPAAVVALGLVLVDRASRGAWKLAVRVGVHTGSAVRRGDDWYGAAVNVAARLADAAGAGEVLLSAQTRRSLGRGGAAGAAHLAGRGRRTFKNVAAPLEVYAAA